MPKRKTWDVTPRRFETAKRLVSIGILSNDRIASALGVATPLYEEALSRAGGYRRALDVAKGVQIERARASRQDDYVAALVECGGIKGDAAAYIGVTLTTVRLWRAENAAFDERVSEAAESCLEELGDEARRSTFRLLREAHPRVTMFVEDRVNGLRSRNDPRDKVPSLRVNVTDEKTKEKLEELPG